MKRSKPMRKVPRLELYGLKKMLEHFREYGKHYAAGRWKIAEGGYDLCWEIYYDGVSVLRYFSNHVLRSDNSDFNEMVNKKMAIQIIKKILM